MIYCSISGENCPLAIFVGGNRFEICSLYKIGVWYWMLFIWGESKDKIVSGDNCLVIFFVEDDTIELGILYGIGVWHWL